MLLCCSRLGIPFWTFSLQLVGEDATKGSNIWREEHHISKGCTRICMDSHAILASYFSRTTATKVANLGERRLPQFGHATTTPKWSTVMLSWVRVTSQIDPNWANTLGLFVHNCRSSPPRFRRVCRQSNCKKQGLVWISKLREFRNVIMTQFSFRFFLNLHGIQF